MQKHMKSRCLLYECIQNGELIEEAGHIPFQHADILVKGPYDFPLDRRQECLHSIKSRKTKQLGINIERI
ncbi:hypothetical protein [Bacillus infantis]|uniref:Uncharacterized protein n=1 Tax=Bacillus infantis TaxID=324767 RepID=A0A5D4RDM7_9BACI|nr:hypothetical protein [Bacillus infantis]TYS47838.1 hypothetical protein FZD51_12975 [Bacillus infantis]